MSTQASSVYRSAQVPAGEVRPSTRAWDRYLAARRVYSGVLSLVCSTELAVFLFMPAHAVFLAMPFGVALYVLRQRVRACSCPECRKPVSGDTSAQYQLRHWLGVFPSSCVHCNAEMLTSAELDARRREQEGLPERWSRRIARKIPGFFVAAVLAVGLVGAFEYDRSGPGYIIEDRTFDKPMRVTISFGQISGFAYVRETHGVGPAAVPRRSEQTSERADEPQYGKMTLESNSRVWFP